MEMSPDISMQKQVSARSANGGAMMHGGAQMSLERVEHGNTQIETVR